MLPNSIIEIPNTAIADLFVLKKLTIPSSVTLIDNYFCAFPVLTQLIFEKNSSLKTVGPHFLNSCPLLEEVIIPSTVLQISTNSFIDSKNLKRIYYLGLTDFSTDSELLSDVSDSVQIIVSRDYPANYFGCKKVINIFELALKTCEYSYYSRFIYSSYLYVFIYM